MPELMKLLSISQDTAYRVRRELKQYHEQASARASQWGNATTREEPVSSQHEENDQ